MTAMFIRVAAFHQGWNDWRKAQDKINRAYPGPYYADDVAMMGRYTDAYNALLAGNPYRSPYLRQAYQLGLECPQEPGESPPTNAEIVEYLSEQ